MNNMTNFSENSFYSLYAMDPSLCTEEGFSIILNDPNLGPETRAKLLRTEAPILKQSRFQAYRYLLEGYNNKHIYVDNFVAGNWVGKAHLTMLIKDNMNQTYAELVAGYAADRDIPFLVAMIYLEAFREVENGIRYYVRTREYLSTREWKPRIVV